MDAEAIIANMIHLDAMLIRMQTAWPMDDQRVAALRRSIIDGAREIGCTSGGLAEDVWGAAVMSNTQPERALDAILRVCR